MSGRALTSVRDLREYADGTKVKPSEKLVLMLLADHKNPNTGQISPSLSTLAEESGLSRQGVVNALATLAHHGVIEAVRSQREGKAVAAVNHYRILLKVVNSVDHPQSEVVNSVDQGSQLSGLRVVNSVDQGSQVSRPLETKEKPKVETKEKRDVETAIAAPAPKARAKDAKPSKTEARIALNQNISTVRRVFAELFAPAAEMDARFMGRNIQDALCYPVDDVVGTLRAIAARNPQAKATGRTISLIDLGSWVAEWIAAARPTVFPTAVMFRRSGETNDRPTSRLAAASARITDADRVRAAREQYQAGAMATSPGQTPSDDRDELHLPGLRLVQGM